MLSTTVLLTAKYTPDQHDMTFENKHRHTVFSFMSSEGSLLTFKVQMLKYDVPEGLDVKHVASH